MFYDVIFLRSSGHVVFQKDIFGPPFTFIFLAWFLETLILSQNILQVLLASFLDVCPLSKYPRKISRNVIMLAGKQEFSKIMSHSAHLEIWRCRKRKGSFVVALQGSFITTHILVTLIWNQNILFPVLLLLCVLYEPRIIQDLQKKCKTWKVT